jgi:hypothetical protein
VLDYSIPNENLLGKGRFGRAAREDGQKEKAWAMRQISVCVQILCRSQKSFHRKMRGSAQKEYGEISP